MRFSLGPRGQLRLGFSEAGIVKKTAKHNRNHVGIRLRHRRNKCLKPQIKIPEPELYPPLGIFPPKIEIISETEPELYPPLGVFPPTI